jgi:hypothetical protein
MRISPEKPWKTGTGKVIQNFIQSFSIQPGYLIILNLIYPARIYPVKSKKELSVDDIEYKNNDPDCGGNCHDRYGTDVNCAPVLAFVIVDETR